MFVIHPDAIRIIKNLAEQGIAYHPSLDFLVFGTQLQGIPEEDVTDAYYTVPCPSRAVEILRARNKEEVLGAKYVSVADLAWNYRNQLPMPTPCPLTWVADLADRYLADPQCKIETEKRRARAEEMHALARNLAFMFGIIPHQTASEIRDEIEKIWLAHH